MDKQILDTTAAIESSENNTFEAANRPIELSLIELLAVGGGAEGSTTWG